MINGGAAESRPAALPSGLPTPGEVDALIAQAMSRLSNEEREKALDDLHGICGMEDEDPSMVSSLLEELDTHLTAIKNETAYALAETKSRKYVSSRGFRMMFLRADRYEPKEAAERMIRFFEVKKHLFGEEKLVKDITLDDLDEGDTEALETGCAQISIGKDKAGRPVVVFLRKLRKYKVTENAVGILGCFKNKICSIFTLPAFLVCRLEGHIMCLWLQWSLQKTRKVGFPWFIIIWIAPIRKHFTENCAMLSRFILQAFISVVTTKKNIRACVTLLKILPIRARSDIELIWVRISLEVCALNVIERTLIFLLRPARFSRRMPIRAFVLWYSKGCSPGDGKGGITNCGPYGVDSETT